MSANKDEAGEFKKELATMFAKEEYDIDNVYSGDESGLIAKSLPTKTLAPEDKRVAPGLKVNKERVTIMNCANETGSHKIPLLLIGKSKKPRCFKEGMELPLIYTNQ